MNVLLHHVMSLIRFPGQNSAHSSTVSVIGDWVDTKLWFTAHGI